MANNEKLQLALEKDLEIVRTSVDEVKKTADAALPSADLPQTQILEFIGNLPIANGGTGANTKKEAFANLAFLGLNPISSLEEDTPQKWLELGSGYAYFDVPDAMNDQPDQNMFVINFTEDKQENLFQIGSLYDGIYYRVGHTYGWQTNWTSLFDRDNIVPIANGGTGANNSVDALNNLGAIPKSRISVPNFGQYNGSIPIHHMDWWTAVDNSFSDVNNIKCSGLMQTVNGWSHLPNSEIAGIDGWGTLIVFAPEDTDKGYQANTNVLQIWYGMNCGDRLFIRKYRSSNVGWSRWQEMFKSNSVIPVANGGTGTTTAANALKNLGITSGTTDLKSGTSTLASGAIYLVYE